MATRTPPGGNGNGNGPSGPRPRILRIGILLGDKFVEERLIREHISVSIGQLMKNTFSIPVEGLPPELTMFALENGRYSLRFLQRMDGRLSDGAGNVATLADLQAGRTAMGQAKKVGDIWEMPLSPTSRGKLQLGDLTVLFQFVTEPPRQPRPMLPASVRGTFADRLDPRLMVILAISIVVHFSFAIKALLTDLDNNGSIADRAYNLTFKPEEVSVELEQPKPKEAPAEATKDAPQEKPAQKQAPIPTKPAKAPDPGAGRDPKQDVALQEENARAMADLLTGESDTGTSQGDMSKRRPGADLGQQIADIREGGKQVAVGGGSGRGSRGDGNARVGTGKGPDIAGPGGTETAGGPKVEHAPTGRISVGDKSGEEGVSLTPDSVVAKIQSVYMAQIKRCYTSYLKKDATARGRITLKLTVNETGRAVSTAASGFNSEVDECVSNLMGTWRFPIPKDKDGDATSAAFSLTLQLVPD